VRVYELARDLGVDSKELLIQAQDLGIDVKTASSGLDDESAELLRLAVAGEPAPRPEPEPETAPEPKREPEPPVLAPKVKTPPSADVGIVSVPAGATVGQFAEAIGISSTDVVTELLMRGQPIGVGQVMPLELIEPVAESFGFMAEIVEAPRPPAVAERPSFEDRESDMVTRPPVVTVMGHVDHGKTTLLDTIRKTSVVEGEQGGITQHIGAYQVEVNGHPITFIDTPGHEAFTALRARGANITDIVVLVVAANDGVMPQTIEAISHAKAAGVKMIVAINKIDLPGADPLRVRTELTEHDVITEELGGDVPSVELSALSGAGVDDLLEVIDLIAQLEEFKANPGTEASGVVVEAQVEKGKGAVASVIVQRGTLQTGDSFVAGAVSGRVRALMDDAGNLIKSAGPSAPVQIMGWDDVPAAGDYFKVMESDKEARRVAEGRQGELKAVTQAMPSARDRLQSLLDQLRTEDATPNRAGDDLDPPAFPLDLEDRAGRREDPDRPQRGWGDQRERCRPCRGDRLGCDRVQRPPRAESAQGGRDGRYPDPHLRDHLRAPRRDRADAGRPACA